jgi:hypothetical protein
MENEETRAKFSAVLVEIISARSVSVNYCVLPDDPLVEIICH